MKADDESSTDTEEEDSENKNSGIFIFKILILTTNFYNNKNLELIYTSILSSNLYYENTTNY